MLVNLYIFYYSVLKFKLQFLTVEKRFAFMNYTMKMGKREWSRIV